MHFFSWMFVCSIGYKKATSFLLSFRMLSPVIIFMCSLVALATALPSFDDGFKVANPGDARLFIYNATLYNATILAYVSGAFLFAALNIVLTLMWLNYQFSSRSGQSKSDQQDYEYYDELPPRRKR